MMQKTRRKSVKLARFGTRVESSRLRLRSRLQAAPKMCRNLSNLSNRVEF